MTELQRGLPIGDFSAVILIGELQRGHPIGELQRGHPTGELESALDLRPLVRAGLV